MGVTGTGGHPALPAGPTKRPPWMVGGLTIVSFIVLLWIIELFDSLTGHRLDGNGIRPLETDGLSGILFAPLLHSDWGHLIANTGPALVLGFLMTLSGLSRFLYATAIVWIVGGLGTWLIGNIGAPTYHGTVVETNHIGASGLIFGWLTFLIVFGFFTRKIWEIVVGVVVLFIYGSILLGVLPGTFGVSWQGHLCGAAAGVLAAYLLSGPERRARQPHRPATTPPYPTR
ncbi:rhomboid family intramembrane serine protease [Mycobacterium sp. ITM-2016-00317]|uniref:rhomboid family intramembrane serine protease n=1 Tax=Mycobacterium sp. ITM-2016-00317 TaxID=2099694 RepID=UPI00287F8067|nr:rhomboid family intramembrane serine protease [Mycobacterium sp. ITM-2016-00317]WNG86111.1 rhomboid family intramembrane serine protease [Mycobacterium sp. ITM-2016-00317]